MEGAGIPYQYEKDRLSYETPGVYTPDFTLPMGVLVEAKGWLSPQDRKKLLAVKRCNPEKDIRILLQEPHRKLGKGPKSSTYAQWCQSHGFPWAKGPEVPDSWLLYRGVL